MFGSILAGLISPVTAIVKGWQARKTAQLDSDLAIAKAKTSAKIRVLETAQAGEIAWDQAAISHSGWKSGYLTIILSLPLILLFVPPMVPFMDAGFHALNSAPDWYKAAVGVMVSADFGIRRYANLMMKGKL